MNQSLRVLVVDDDEAIRNLLVRIIGKTYTAQAAGDGEQAVALAQTQAFDVAFVDMRMPGMDGLDTMRALKQILPEITIVIITGYADNERIEQALREGAITCLKKPFSLQEIRSLLSREKISPAEGEPLRVLAVDDDLTFRRLFEHLGDTEQYQVTTVANAPEALEQVRANAYAVAFIDVVLPGVDGIRLADEIRQASPATKIIMFTGQDEYYQTLQAKVDQGVRYALKKTL